MGRRAATAITPGPRLRLVVGEAEGRGNRKPKKPCDLLGSPVG
jgi:hypothetical protein